MAETTMVIYRLQDDANTLNIPFDGTTVWLTKDQITELFGVDGAVISKHIADIIEEGAVDDRIAISRMEIVKYEGDRRNACIMAVFNLDMILAVGDRVDPEQAAIFKNWVDSLF